MWSDIPYRSAVAKPSSETEFVREKQTPHIALLASFGVSIVAISEKGDHVIP